MCAVKWLDLWFSPRGQYNPLDFYWRRDSRVHNIIDLGFWLGSKRNHRTTTQNIFPAPFYRGYVNNGGHNDYVILQRKKNTFWLQVQASSVMQSKWHYSGRSCWTTGMLLDLISWSSWASWKAERQTDRQLERSKLRDCSMSAYWIYPPPLVLPKALGKLTLQVYYLYILIVLKEDHNLINNRSLSLWEYKWC